MFNSFASKKRFSILKYLTQVTSISPIKTTCFICSFLCFSGDVITQLFIEERSILKQEQEGASDVQRFDTPRCLRALLLGAVFVGSYNYTWYFRILPKLMDRMRVWSFFRNYQNLGQVVLGKFRSIVF